MTLDLRIDPVKPYQARDYAFKVTSRSIEQEMDAAYPEAPLVVEEKSLHVAGVPWVRRLLPFLFLYGAAIALPFIVFWLVNRGA